MTVCVQCVYTELFWYHSPVRIYVIVTPTVEGRYGAVVLTQCYSAAVLISYLEL